MLQIKKLSLLTLTLLSTLSIAAPTFAGKEDVLEQEALKYLGKSLKAARALEKAKGRLAFAQSKGKENIEVLQREVSDLANKASRVENRTKGKVRAFTEVNGIK